MFGRDAAGSLEARQLAGGTCRPQPPRCLQLPRPGWSVLLLLALLPAAALGQQDSPLKGQYNPDLSIQDVFVSVYLDRLLEVDCFNYRHTSILYLWITWNDSTAAETVRRNTELAKNGTRPCSKPCTNFADSLGYLPSFFFHNAYGFPQDREEGYKIYALQPPIANSSSVLWVSHIHGTYYQPFDFRHFPFDSLDLLVEMEFLDTAPSEHPGVKVHFSSGGTKMYSVGRGDDTSEWDVDSISFKANNEVDTAAWFETYSSVPSDPRDPLPLHPTAPGIYNPFQGNVDQVFAIFIRISRFWRYHLIYSVLPILLVAYLGLLVLVLDKADLASRLHITVTIYLSLAAVQFVVGTRQPYSSYVIPTQQLVLATYVLFAIIALESIVVFHINSWKATREKEKCRQEARRRHLNRVSRPASPRHLSSEPSSFKSDGCLPISTSPSGTANLPSMPTGGQAEVAGDREAGTADPTGLSRRTGVELPRKWRFWCGKSCRAGDVELRRVGSGLSDSLSGDELYAEYVAHLIDMTTLAFLFLAYNLTAVLIFTLQNGYINTFD